MAVLALTAAAFVLNLNTNVLGALLPFLDRLGIATGQSGFLLVFAGSLGTAVGSLGVGAAVRHWGRRRVLLGSLTAFALASALHASAEALPLLLLLRSLTGLAVGLAYAVASALAAEVSPYARRGAAMGSFSAGMFLAIPVGMPLAVWLARNGSWQSIFVVQAVVGMLAAGFACVMVPDLPGSTRRSRWRDVLGNGQARAGLAAMMLHVGSFFTVVQIATSWLDRTGRVPKEDQMGVWVALGMLSVVGSATLGRLADRVGKRTFTLVCSLILVACFAALALEPGPRTMLSVAAVLALAASARTGPLQALLSGTVERHHLPALMGLRSAAMQLGIAAFSLLALPFARGLGFTGVLFLAAGCQALSYLAIRFGIRAK